LATVLASTKAFIFPMMRPGALGFDFSISLSMRQWIVSWVVTGEIMNLPNIAATVWGVNISPPSTS